MTESDKKRNTSAIRAWERRMDRLSARKTVTRGERGGRVKAWTLKGGSVVSVVTLPRPKMTAADRAFERQIAQLGLLPLFAD